jgi:ketosteroid isomerase-like protein
MRALPTQAGGAGTTRGQTEAMKTFGEFLPCFELGIERFLNGDATLWKSNVSQESDATIMGAWGDYEKSWSELEPRYDWAAARFEASGAQVQFQYLSSGVSGELAFTVAIERSTVRLAGQKEPASMALRVTHLFRKEQGEWKLLHRHADPLMSKTAPAAVLRD